MIKFVSLCFPSDWHDIHQARYCQVKWKIRCSIRITTQWLWILVTLVFIMIMGHLLQSSRRSLTVAEKSRNFSLASVRSKIERVFGTLKSKFKIISDNSRPFDGTPEKLHEVFHIVCAIYNCDLEDTN